MQQTSSQPTGLKRTIWPNFHDSETASVAPVSVEDVRKAELSIKESVGFVMRKAKEERYLQVMWLSVCRIFWLKVLHIYYRAISIKHSKVELANHMHVIEYQSNFGIPLYQWILYPSL
jgi:hypothetical protein